MKKSKKQLYIESLIRKEPRLKDFIVENYYLVEAGLAVAPAIGSIRMPTRGIGSSVGAMARNAANSIRTGAQNLVRDTNAGLHGAADKIISLQNKASTGIAKVKNAAAEKVLQFSVKHQDMFNYLKKVSDNITPYDQQVMDSWRRTNTTYGICYSVAYPWLWGLAAYASEKYGPGAMKLVNKTMDIVNKNTPKDTNSNISQKINNIKYAMNVLTSLAAEQFRK